jgi:hypothetical protein
MARKVTRDVLMVGMVRDMNAEPVVRQLLCSEPILRRAQPMSKPFKTPSTKKRRHSALEQRRFRNLFADAIRARHVSA